MVMRFILKKKFFRFKTFVLVKRILFFFYKDIKFYLNYINNNCILFVVDKNYHLYNYNLANLGYFCLFNMKNIWDDRSCHGFNFVKLNIIGLGYKYFFYKRYIYLLIGLSHFMLFKLPFDIFLRCKRKKMFLISNNKKKLISFANLIKFAKKPNIYKGKGITEFFQFKNFMTLKKGKKQQVS